MNIGDKIYHYFLSVFKTDIRALALMRMLLAVLLLLDLTVRVSDIKAHYTDEGVLPIEYLLAHNWNNNYFSFHAWSGSQIWQIILFSISFLFAGLLFIGYKTRTASFISWLLLISIHNRNGLVLQGGDELFRILLFYGIFLPWGDRYSLDSLLQKEKQNTNTFFGAAGVGYILLIFSVYVFSALMKSSAEWHEDGTAMYYALSLDQMVLPIGKWIYPHFTLLKFFTWATMFIELFIPFLLFIPWKNNVFRWIVIICVIALQAGISLTLFVGLFFLIASAAMAGLIPGSYMDKLDKKLEVMKTEIRKIYLRMYYLFLRHFNLNLIDKIKKNTNIFNLLQNGRELFLTIIIVYQLLWCCTNTAVIPIAVSNNFKFVGYALRLDQNWGMFAPSVFKDDGWYIMAATTVKGDTIDLWNEGKTISYQKPLNIVAMFKNDRWRKYSENYLMINNAWMRPFWCKMLMEEWNKNPNHDPIKELKIIYMKEVTQPDYLYTQPIREVLFECKAGNL